MIPDTKFRQDQSDSISLKETVITLLRLLRYVCNGKEDKETIKLTESISRPIKSRKTVYSKDFYHKVHVLKGYISISYCRKKVTKALRAQV